MSKRGSIAIRVPRVRPEEAGPRDAESRAVGNYPAFQRLVHESRRRRAAGDRGTSLDDALAEADVAAATHGSRPAAPAESLAATWSALLTRFVDRRYVDGTVGAGRASDIADLPIDALQGVRKEDAEAIQKALGVRTIRQFAEHRLVRAAQALTLLAGQQAG